MMALGAVKSGVAFYKEAKSVGKEAVNVITEIADGLGSFFEHQEKAVEYAKEIEKNPPKGKSLQAIALDNVISCLLYTSPSPRDRTRSRMPSSA